MRSRRAVGSLIGIGFLLMIIAVGFSYYEVVNRVERNSAGIIQEMAALDRDSADEALEIQRVQYKRPKNHLPLAGKHRFIGASIRKIDRKSVV